MPGKLITGKQYGLYMQARKLGKSQQVASAKAGLSIRTGRNLEKKGCLPSQRPKREGKRRKGIFDDVWKNIIIPYVEKAPFLSASMILEHLQDLYPDQYTSSNLRMLQHKLQQWRALHGPEREVMFAQEHLPGRQGLSDFTKLKNCQVTINGEVFEHLLYHFRLAYSRWSYMHVVQGGESFTALSCELQNALWCLGGVPLEHRSDSLSAAYKNLSPKDQEDFTKRYEALCNHYNMTATRNNRGKGHENGSVESAHGHLKSRLHQALELRGSYDFDSIAHYQQFIDQVVAKHNQRHQKLIKIERQQLQPLPAHRTIDFDEITARVSTTSTIIVKKIMYSVPSRLIGQRLRVHIYDDRLMCYLGGEKTLELPRLRAKTGKCVDYKHVITSLVRKPQAFRYSILREDLLPDATYKEIWCLMDQHCSKQQACKLMVNILKLANDSHQQDQIGTNVLKLLRTGHIPSLGQLQRKYNPSRQRQSLPQVSGHQHSLKDYDNLLNQLVQGGYHA